MKILQIVGIVLIIMGAVDLIGSYANFDLWGGFFGIQLPELLWKFSSYIELGLGFLLFNIGSSGKEESTEEG